MAGNKINYYLDLSDKESLRRILQLIRNHYNILEILNKDSEKSVDGGAMVNYVVKITLEEMWT